MSNSSQISPETHRKSTWQDILREAVRGSSRDFTEGSIGLAIFLLAVPMVLEMLMESVFGLVDIYFVAKLGADAVAIVGLTESMLAIIFAFSIGLSIGATAMVARRTGEGDSEGAAHVAAHALYMGVAISLAVSIVGVIFAPHFLAALGAAPHVVQLGTPFTRIMLGGNAVIVFLFLLNAIFRGAGDAAVAMRVLVVANLLNIVLAPLFIFGQEVFAVFGLNAPQWLRDAWIFPKLGVTGAAVATTIGRGVGVLMALWLLLQPGGRIALRRRHWKFDTKLAKGFIQIAAPAILQFAIATASWSVLVRVIAGFGSEAIAGYVIGLRVILFALLPAMGLSNATSTLVGQNLGAGKSERAQETVWRAAFINAALLGAVSLLLLGFSAQIVGAFTQEAEVLRYGTQSLHIVAYGFVFYAFGMVLESSFNGAGDTWTPTALNFLAFWLFEIPLAYLLAYRFEMGPAGVFWAITAAFSLLAVLSAVIFRRGNWKTKKV